MLLLAAAAVVTIIDMTCVPAKLDRLYGGVQSVQCVALLDQSAPPGSTCRWTWDDLSSTSMQCYAEHTHEHGHPYLPRATPYEITFTVYSLQGGVLAERQFSVTSLEPQARVEPKARTGKARLAVRAFPRVGFAHPVYGLGVTIRAELEGAEEPESLYCPKVEWWLSGELLGTEESDCPAYDARTEYPRSWSRSLAVGPGEHVFEVKLLRAGHVVAAKQVIVTAMN